jgi:SAM-dependent methyltransferase
MEVQAVLVALDKLPQLNSNEEWYLALTAIWARRLRAGSSAGPDHDPAPDVAFAERVLGLCPGMRVLDLATGWGRTAMELARRGYRVTAFDLSPELLAIGRERAAIEGLEVSFACGTARLLPDMGTFDAVCAFYDDCLLSFEDEADNRAALLAVARSLRPGGRLLFGTTDCPLLLPAHQFARRLEGGLEIEETIDFDRVGRVGVSERRHLYADGHSATFRRVRRHRTLNEATTLLADAGMRVCDAWAAYDEALPYGCRPEGMVIAAVRGPGALP